MKPFSTLLLLLLVVSLNAQNIDSIRVLNEKSKYYIPIDKDSTKYFAELSYQLNNHRFPSEEALSKLYVGMHYKRHGDYDTAYHLFNDAKEALEDLGLHKELGNAYWYLGKVWHELHQFERAIPLYNKAYDELKIAEDYSSQVKVLNGLGMMESFQGNYLEGLEWFKKCLDIVHKNNLHDMAFRLNANIAVIHTKNGDLELALEYLRKGLGLHKVETEKYHIITAMGNMAKTFRDLGRRDSAHHYYEKAVALAQEWKMDEEYINEAKLRLSNYEKDFQNSTRILKSLLKTEHVGRKSSFLTQLTRAFKKNNQLDSAIHYGSMAYDYNLEHNSNEHAKNTAAMLAQLYEKKGNYIKALDYQKKYIALNDSIFKESDLKKGRDLMVQIETIEAANEIELLKSELQIKELKEISMIRLIVTSLIILGLIVASFFYRLRARRLQMAMQIQKQKAELGEKSNELQMQTLHMARHTNTLTELEDGIKKLMPHANGMSRDLQRLLTSIKMDRNMNKEWEKFESYFSNVYEGFVDQLKVKFPSLTVNDTRLCTLLRLNLSNHEVSTIMNIESKSVRMAKYRLRKKLQLPKETDLTTFLQEVDGK